MVNGTTQVRTHVETDPVVGLRGFEGVLAARDAFVGRVDVQICVFPQEGLAVEPTTVGLLVEALGSGATVIGGAPYTDPDPESQIDMVFDLARDFDVDIDLHLDLSETTEAMQIEYVCRKVEERSFHGRVTVGHVTQLSLVPPAELERIAALVASAGISVTTLPATDLFLMGRDATHAKPRGVAPIDALRRHGVRCSISTNNVLNSFTPFGDGSLLRMANLYANVAHVSDPAALRDCFSMITDQAAGIMGCERYGLEVGSPADLVLLDATDPAAAVAELAPAVWGFKGGRATFTRPAVVLHRETTSAS
jgi:cytosine deaminase